MSDFIVLQRARINAVDYYRNVTFPQLLVERGYATNLAEDVLRSVSAKGVGGQKLLRIPKELEFVDWNSEMCRASHRTVGAVAGAANHT